MESISYDFGCGEVAGNDSDSKIISDEGKLLREAEEVVDNLLLDFKVEDNHHCYSWVELIAGFSCFVETLRLDSSGSYVTVPKFSSLLPSNISEFSHLPDILLHLMKIKVGSI